MPEGMQLFDPADGKLVSDFNTRHGGIVGYIELTSSNQTGSYSVPGLPSEAVLWPLLESSSLFFPEVNINGHTISWVQAKDNNNQPYVTIGRLGYGIT